MNIDLAKIGNFLCEQRNKKGLTQEQLASLVGASYKTISKWECGGSFPDVIYQMSLCNVLGISLKELQMGCFDLNTRRKNKLLTIFSIVSLILLLIFVPVLLFLIVFYIGHYGKPRIYQLIHDDDAEVFANVSGMLIEDYNSNYLMINSVQIIGYEDSIDDIVSIDLVSDNKIIYHVNDFHSFVLMYPYTRMVDKNKLKLMIEIQSVIGEKDTYEIQLHVDDHFQANHIFNDKQSSNRQRYDFLNALKAMGFQYVKDDIWTFKKDGGEQLEISYYSMMNKIVYRQETQDTIEIYNYFKNYNSLETNIYTKNHGSNILLEKYIYYYDNKKLDCLVGICASYLNALNTMDKYVTLLKGE